MLQGLAARIAGILKSCQNLLGSHMCSQQLSLLQHLQDVTQGSSHGCPRQLPLHTSAAIPPVLTAVRIALLHHICIAADLRSCGSANRLHVGSFGSAGGSTALVMSCNLKEQGLQGWCGRIEGLYTLLSLLLQPQLTSACAALQSKHTYRLSRVWFNRLMPKLSSCCAKCHMMSYVDCCVELRPQVCGKHDYDMHAPS